jgi:hypothetical protein
MQTLTYGLVKPTSGTKGSDFFPALEDNFEQIDGHTHNGTNSPKLTSASTTGVQINVPAASWAATGVTGLYSQTVTLPAALPYSTSHISFQESVSGDVFLLQVEKVSETVFEVFCNDSSLTFKAIVTT